ncbi:MAG: ABC transporter permease [Bdellovibrionales bacterium]|nr:ABC transporter permease [Bdellovibrionales bacterium]
MMRRILWMMRTRNREFFRDRSSLGWNLAFPLLIVAGFALIFSGRASQLIQVGIVGGPEAARPAFAELLAAKHTSFVVVDSAERGLDRVRHHRLDLLLDPGASPPRYWISESSPKGYFAEKLLLSGGGAAGSAAGLSREAVSGRDIPYVEWVFPGVLGMNLMFSALWGVGWVVVRYRKNGVLKRLRATPVSAFEFLSAQILSRILLLVGVAAFVYGTIWLIYRFECRGSLALLGFTFALGAVSMIAIGLLVASRTQSEEFANGILNFVSMPMMFLSEVWFSLESAPGWVRAAAGQLPLTHLVKASRAIMNDGAGLAQVQGHLFALALTGAFLLALASAIFKWERD